jgi:MFS family permease
VSTPTHPLHIRDFRFFWASRFSANLATSGMVVIIGYQLYDLARHDYGLSIAQASFMLGVLGLVQFVPIFLLSPLAGLVADRMDRRHIVFFSLSVDLLVAAGLGLATQLHALTLQLLFGLAVAHGVARVFMMPASGAIAPMIVPAHLLPRAVAFNSLAFQTGVIVGPALAGLLYGWWAPAVYWFSAVLLGVGVLGALGISPLPPHAANRGGSPWRQILEGFAYVRGSHFLLGCITLDLFAVLLGGATAALPIFARDILHVGASGLGPMRAASAVGAVSMGLVLSVRPLSRHVGLFMLGSVAAFGLATAAFGLSTNYYLSLALLVVLGAADMISMFVRGSLVQLHTPDAMRGRVSAISGVAISASNELGEFETGLAAWLLGPVGAVVAGGLGAVVITLGWAWLFPEIRRADRFSDGTAHEEQGA